MKQSSLLITSLFSLCLFLNANDTLPNIVLIFADDMAYGDASCYGGDLIETQNIDKLADEGIKFDTAYSISPVCGPSRVGLLTGTYPGRSGVYWNPDMGGVQLSDDRPILPIQLKKAGYKTAIVGKWNLDNPSWNPMPVEKYFDHTANTMVWEGDYWPDASGHYHGVNDDKYGSTKTNNIWGPTSKGDIYLTDLLTQSACDFIDKNSDAPFFLYLSYNAPHSPLQGKLSHKKRLSHIKSEALKLYASMLLAVDEGVGQVLDTLDKKDIKKDTVVIFLSDNGPAKTNFKGLPKEWPRGEMLGSTNGLRGHKGEYFEGGIRVPFIVSWPGNINLGETSNTPISSLDIYPTLSAIAGIDLPNSEPFEGVNLLPLLMDKKSEISRDHFFWAGGRIGKNTGAILKDDWKLVINHKGKDFLFNLENDPNERINLIANYPNRSNALRSIFKNTLDEMPEPLTDRSKLK
jgi:arylsulfatase A-like enzyme